jgi:hypothetical protein
VGHLPLSPLLLVLLLAKLPTLLVQPQWDRHLLKHHPLLPQRQHPLLLQVLQVSMVGWTLQKRHDSSMHTGEWER